MQAFGRRDLEEGLRAIKINNRGERGYGIDVASIGVANEIDVPVDKARLVLDPRTGETLIARATATLSHVAGKILLGCGTENRYADLPFEVVHDAVAGAGPLSGLTAGLEFFYANNARSGARGGAMEWVFVLACDTPFVTSTTLAQLLDRLIREPGVDAVVPCTEAGAEPLAAVYRVGVARKLRLMLDLGVHRLAPDRSGIFETRSGLAGAGPTRRMARDVSRFDVTSRDVRVSRGHTSIAALDALTVLYVPVPDVSLESDPVVRSSAAIPEFYNINDPAALRHAREILQGTGGSRADCDLHEQQIAVR